MVIVIIVKNSVLYNVATYNAVSNTTVIYTKVTFTSVIYTKDMCVQLCHNFAEERDARVRK